MTHLKNTSASPSNTRRKRPLAPDLSRLEPRSARAWTESMAVTPLGEGRYAVESASGKEYCVDLPAGVCTCPDNGFRNVRCKHLRRVAVEVTRGDLAPPGRLPGDCAACGRERLLPEAGPSLCDDCRIEAGETVRDRETGELVVVAEATDTPADEWITDEGRAVADYETNESYPADDPVVTVVYPFSKPRTVDIENLSRYGFPHSRLARTGAQLIE